MANGAGWSALGAALQGGLGGFAQAKLAQQQAQTVGLQQKLLQDQVNELPDRHAEDKLKNILALQGPDAAADNQGFADIGRKLGLFGPAPQAPTALPSGAEGPELPPAEAASRGYNNNGKPYSSVTGLTLPNHPMTFEKLKTDMGGERMFAYDPKTGTGRNIDTGSGGNTGNLDPNASGEATLQGLDPKQATLIKGVASYDLTLSPRAPNYAAVMTAAKQYDPTFSESEYPARAALRTAFKKGTDSQTNGSLNQVVQHIGKLKDAGDALNNTSFPAANYVKNLFQENILGDGRQPAYGLAGDAVANELAKVFKGTGQSGEHEIQSFREHLGAAKSPAAQKAVIDEALQLLSGRHDTQQGKWRMGMGTDKPYQIYTPESQKVLDRLIGTAPAAGSPVPDAPPQAASTDTPPPPPVGMPPHPAGQPLTIAQVKARMAVGGKDPTPDELRQMIGALKAEGTPVMGDDGAPRPNGAPPNVAGQAPPVPLDTNRLPAVGGTLPGPAPRILGNAMSPAGLSALQAREGGFQATPYPDVNGLAIGYGNHTWQGKPVTAATTATKPEADAEMLSQIKSTYGKVVDQALQVPVSPQQYDALVSMAWNLPAAAKRVIGKLNNREPLTAADFQVSATVHGKPHKGLTQRRTSEFADFMGTRAGTP